MDSTNNSSAWADVVPMTPQEAQLEMQFIVLDLLDEGGDIDAQEFFARLSNLFNRVYLCGWQDCHQTMLDETTKMIMEGIAYYGSKRGEE